MREPRLPFCVLALLLLVGSVAALYEKGGPVVQLTQRSFDAVTGSKVPVVVEFFAPWCGHCKALAPAYTRAASKLQGIVPFVAVDCDREANRPLCGQYGVQGFPTIKLFSPSAKGGGPTVTDYQGERSAKALADAALGLLTTKHVKRIKSAEEAAAFASSPGTKVVLVTDKADTPAMLKSFSQRFATQGLSFARIQAKSPQDAAAVELLAALGGGVEGVPTLMALGADGSRTVYQGETKAPLILDWLKQLAGGKKSEGEGSTSSGTSSSTDGTGSNAGGTEQPEAGSDAQQGRDQAGGKREGRQVPAELPQVVANVTAAELARRLDKEGVTLVAFYAGSEDGCRESLNKLNAAVHGLQGLATGVQLDLSDESDAAAVKDLYSIALQEPGQGGCEIKVFLLPFDPEDHEDVDEWRPWTGELSSKELYKAAVELFPAAGITPLTAETYPAFASMSGVTRVKILLFTDKEEPPAVYRALSANFRGYKMDFGLVHSGEAGLMRQFNVQQVPHLLALFASPEEGGKAAGSEGRKQVQIGIQPYIGPLRYGSIAGWLTMVGLQTGTAPEDTLLEFGGQRQDAMVARVTDQASWEASCLSKGGVCVVAALSADSTQQAAQLEVLRSAAAGRGEQPLHFCWFQLLPASAGGRKQSEKSHSAEGTRLDSSPAAEAAAARRFAEQLGLSTGSAPALVAVAPKKERAAVMTARFDKDSIAEWLDGLLSGKVRTTPLHQLPAFPDGSSSNGGGGEDGAAAEGAEEEEEEEFDLSEIMQEEIEGDLSKAAAGRKDEL